LIPSRQAGRITEGAQLQAGAGIAASAEHDSRFDPAVRAQFLLTRPTMKHLTRLLFVTVVTALLVSGCAARSVRVAELKDRPAKYQDKSVNISGTVTRSWGIPLVPFQLYNVDDGSGEITVVSNGSRTPTTGSHVRVKGKVNEVAVFGGRSIGLHLQEQNRKIE
jgi:hypothetical protein